MSSHVRTSIVGTVLAIQELVDMIALLPTNPPSLYFDLEGVHLCREGSISILTLMLHPQKQFYLIDIHVLGAVAFNTPGENGKTLKDILESPTIPKVFFDVRNDSDALYSHYQVELQGIENVQLMENASRRPGNSKQYINGLAKCIKSDLALPYAAKKHLEDTKTQGERLFSPRLNVSYEVFNERPLKNAIMNYCSGDVQYLPALRTLYLGKLTAEWKSKVVDATEARVRESQSVSYQPKGQHRTLGPWQNENTLL